MIDEAKIMEILQQAGLDVQLSQDDFDKPYNDIGLDSLDVFNLLTEVEVVLGKQVDDSDFEHINTLNDLIRFLNK